jgi:hypothetical protein
MMKQLKWLARAAANPVAHDTIHGASRMLNKRALSGFLIVTLQAPMALAAEFSVPATLALALPGQAPTAKCAAVTGGRDPAAVTMKLP